MDTNGKDIIETKHCKSKEPQSIVRVKYEKRITASKKMPKRKRGWEERRTMSVQQLFRVGELERGRKKEKKKKSLAIEKRGY